MIIATFFPENLTEKVKKKIKKKKQLQYGESKVCMDV